MLIDYDDESKFLEPWDISKIPDKFRSRFDFLFPKMSVLNGFTKCWNTIIMFHLIYGNRMLYSRITNAFVWYLNLFKFEPFVEHTDGRVTLDPSCNDASITLRVKLYMRCIQEEMDYKIDEDVLHEIYCNMFINPQRQTEFIKKMKGAIINCAFCKSTTGTMVSWIDSTLTSFDPRPMFSENVDATTIIRLEKDVNANLSEFRDNGYVHLAAKLENMISCEVNMDSVADYSTYWFIEALSGYLHGNFSNITISSIQEAAGARIERKNNMIKDHLYRLWYEALEYWVKKLPLTEEEYIIDMYSDLTTKSNGLNEI